MRKSILLVIAVIFCCEVLPAQGEWTVLNTSNSNIPSDKLGGLGMAVDKPTMLTTSDRYKSTTPKN